MLTLMLVGPVQQAGAPAWSTLERNNLKQIGVAAYNFHENFSKYPPRGVATPTGVRPDESEPDMVPQAFLTDILPLMDRAEHYHRIQRDKAWSDPANQQSFATIVSEYLHLASPAVRTNAEGYAVAHVATNSQTISDTATVAVADITDGLSKTMMAGTLNDGFKAWGDPTNHRDPSMGFGGGPNAFGAPNRRFTTILMFDGSVRQVSPDLAADIAAKIADPRDGQTVPDF